MKNIIIGFPKDDKFVSLDEYLRIHCAKNKKTIIKDIESNNRINGMKRKSIYFVPNHINKIDYRRVPKKNQVTSKKHKAIIVRAIKYNLHLNELFFLGITLKKYKNYFDSLEKNNIIELSDKEFDKYKIENYQLTEEAENIDGIDIININKLIKVLEISLKIMTKVHLSTFLD